MKLNVPIALAATATAITAAAGLVYFLFRETNETENVIAHPKNDSSKKKKQPTKKSEREQLLHKLDMLIETNKESKILMNKLKVKFAEDTSIEDIFKYAVESNKQNFSEMDYPHIEAVLEQYQNDEEINLKLQKLIGSPEDIKLTEKSLSLTIDDIIKAHTLMRDDIKNFIEIYKKIKDKVGQDPVITTLVCQAFMEFNIGKQIKLDASDIECAIYRLGTDLKASEAFRTLNFEIQYYLSQLANTN